MSHRNARLTPAGRRFSSNESASRACPFPTWPRPWGSHANARIGGWRASMRRVSTDSRTARAARTARREPPTPHGGHVLEARPEHRAARPIWRALGVPGAPSIRGSFAATGLRVWLSATR